jgi:hypothetical protein
MRGVYSGRLFQPRMLLERVHGHFSDFAGRLLAAHCACALGDTYPFLMSFSLSTKMSKSIASGESKSYSFLNAAADSSGVNGL